MSYEISRLFITDNNYHQFNGLDALKCGGQTRIMGTLPRKSIYGSLKFADTNIPIIPMTDWPDAIADLERHKATLKHIWQDIMPQPVLNQGQLGFCHAFATVMAFMVKRAVQGLPYREFSSSSVACPITNWRNQGAAIDEDLEQIVKYGVAPIEWFPQTTNDRNRVKSGWEQEALKYQVYRWLDGKSRNFVQQGSLLLSGQPTVVGLNYWGHAVCDMVLRDVSPNLPATDPLRYGVEFLNSWDRSWGDGGWAVRVDNRKYADDFFAITSLSLSL